MVEKWALDWKKEIKEKPKPNRWRGRPVVDLVRCGEISVATVTEGGKEICGASRATADLAQPGEIGRFCVVQ